jgi:hypothetical protein
MVGDHLVPADDHHVMHINLDQHRRSILTPPRHVASRGLHRFAQNPWLPDQHEPPCNPYDNVQCESFMKALKYEA